MTAADTLVLQSSAPSAQPRTRPSLRRVVNAARNIDRFEPVIAKFLRFTILATNGKVEPCIDELEVHSVGTDTSPAQNVALAKNGVKATSSGNYANNPKHLLPHIHDGRFGNGRSWISDTSGKGWVELEFPSAHTIDRVTWGRDRDRRYKDRLPTRYEISVATKPGDWRVVASSEDRSPIASALAAVNPSLAEISNELSASEARLTKLNKRSVVFAGQFTQKPAATRFLYRGNPMSERHLVTPAIPAIFGHAQIQGEAEHDRRTALARWIISPDNPLTSRVIVNRIWQHHFGAGLVDTPSDFGHAGQAPTHPALLDWIARALVDGGWSLKHIHRIILHSTTYKQGGRPRPDAVRKDSGNRMLWRFAPRRLEAEVIRDSILASSGALDLTMGGPGFSLFAPNSNYVRVYVPKVRWTPDTFRRMVYAHKVRMEPGGVFGAFDCPDAGQAAPKRSRSTTALQSLNLFNSTFVMQQADTLAKRIRGSHKTASGQVRMAFNLTLGRAPSTTEAANSMDLASKHGLPALCRVLFNTNEFLVLP